MIGARTLYAQQLYLRRKQHGLCTNCGHKARPRRNMCEKCAETQAGYNATPEHKASVRAANRRARERYRKEGRCLWCAARARSEATQLCSVCREKRNARQREVAAQRRAKRIACRPQPAAVPVAKKPSLSTPDRIERMLALTQKSRPGKLA